MRTRRVGSISMAMTLILFGILILIGQVSQLSVVGLSIKFWPLILILLGGEILYLAFKESRGQENFHIKYDIFSIFIVMLILVVNISIYGLLETGVLDYIKFRLDRETIRYEESYR